MHRAARLAAATFCAIGISGCAAPGPPAPKSYLFVDASFRQTRNHIMNPGLCKETFDDVAGAWAAEHKLEGSPDRSVPVEKGGRVRYAANDDPHGAITVTYRLLRLDEPTARVELHVEMEDRQELDQGSTTAESLRVNELMAQLRRALSGC